jgi:hypothetical protein
VIIYKVINNKDNTAVAYFLKYENALQSVKFMKTWLIDSYHVESVIVDENK